MQNLIVLGHNGMLGNMVCSYFKKKFNIITSDLKFTHSNLKEFSNFIKTYPDSIIINCIGKIKQKSEDVNELLFSNTILPIQLSELLSSNQILINPSTDCVFSGTKKTGYRVDEKSDVFDSYGWSKSLGERVLIAKRNIIIVRVSIIGMEIIEKPKGLLGWFLNVPNEELIHGFNNHYWNGITTLEWCKQVEKIILNYEYYENCNLIQLGMIRSYSKFEMLNLFRKVFQTKHKIVEFEAEQEINRVLIPTIISAIDLEQQLYELKSFNENN